MAVTKEKVVKARAEARKERAIVFANAEKLAEFNFDKVPV